MRRPAMIILLFALSLIEKDYSSIEEVDADLKFVCKEVTEAAISLIQKKKIKQGAKVKDPTLSHLCWKCRCTFRTWKHAGRPTCGPVSDERKQCKRAVKSYLHEQVLLMQMTFSSAGWITSVLLPSPNVVQMNPSKNQIFEAPSFVYSRSHVTCR